PSRLEGSQHERWEAWGLAASAASGGAGAVLRRSPSQEPEAQRPCATSGAGVGRALRARRRSPITPRYWSTWRTDGDAGQGAVTACIHHLPLNRIRNADREGRRADGDGKNDGQADAHPEDQPASGPRARTATASILPARHHRPF